MRKNSPICFLFILIFIPEFIFSQNIAVNTSGNPAAAANLFEVTQTNNTANYIGIYSGHSGTGSGAIGIYSNFTGIGSGSIGIFANHTGSVGAGNTGYGLQAIKTGTSGTNVAGYFSASGAGATNYAIIVPSGGGKTGIGISTPSNYVDIVGGAARTGTHATNAPLYVTGTFGAASS